MAAFYDKPARYRATGRGWIPGPKVADPTTPLSRGTGARVVERGEEFDFDGRPGEWMEPVGGDAESAKRVKEADEYRGQMRQIAEARAQAGADGTVALVAVVQQLAARLEVLEGGGGKHHKR
jgi:hypothetical protein